MKKAIISKKKIVRKKQVNQLHNDDKNQDSIIPVQPSPGKALLYFAVQTLVEYSAFKLINHFLYNRKASTAVSSGILNFLKNIKKK